MGSIYEAEAFLRKKMEDMGIVPQVGIVLGSGLGGLADKIKVAGRVAYSEIEGFPVSTVEGHKGEYIFGYIEDTPVMLMNGRVHFYEGYPMRQVVVPVQVMGLIVKKIILTNASGSLNRDFRPGTLMCITDLISSFVPSPLIGPNDEKLGTRFPEMSQIYNRDFQKILHEVADEQGIPLVDGVYVQVTGPAYESPAESKFYAICGGDAVGMSTACEAVMLNYMGVKLLGISCITDMAIDNEDTPVTHEEVQKIAGESSEKLISLVYNTVIRM